MILLDTHAFIWLASDQRKLSRDARNLIQVPGQSAAISLVTAWEIALLVKRGRLELPVETDEYIEHALSHHRIHEISLTREIVLHAASLPEIHNDPFDRVIAATAQLQNLTLISKDKAIARYPGVAVVW